MKDIRTTILIILTVACTASFGQPDSMLLRTASPKTLKKLGQSALRQKDPGSAVLYLEAYLKRDRKDAKATALLGQAYKEMRDYERAQVAFLRAYQTDRENAPEALYYHALMQKSNGLYDSAGMRFRQFRKEYRGPRKDLKKQAVREIAFCDSVQQIAKTDPKILVTRLDSSINKVNSEGAPVSIDDSTLLFSSLRTDRQEYIIEDDTAETIRKKLYTARLYGSSWQYSGQFAHFNDEGFNTGNVSFSADRKRAYFTRCKKNLMEEMICAIYLSEKKGDAWTEPVKLPGPVNLRGSTSTMPAVMTDPAKGTDIIYFVSDRADGKGGLDLWYTAYNKKKGIYTEPKNAGNKINTAQDEITPFFDNETRTLYFSSDGWGGLGGFDIYRATGDGKRWAGTVNMGQPLNSGADDVYYSISTNREEGFFVSNRKGGVALKNRTCCDDIYAYKNTDYINISVQGVVSAADADSLPVASATVDVYVKDSQSAERYLVKSTQSDSAGNFRVKLEPRQEYVIVVRSRDFLSGTEEISTRDIVSNQNFEKNVRLNRRPKGTVVIPKIEYAFGKADLTDSSKKILDQMLLTLLQNNPDIVVQINSHTDSKGNDLFNMKLSQKRAESVIRHLNSKGISMNRMQPKGFGETMPLEPNDLPDGSDNPDGRARNRRTEFQIIGTIQETEEEAETPLPE